jgi:glucosyl-3-phosphoglycerate synthase
LKPSKNRLNEFSDKYPSGVIIPIIGQDLESPALPGIINGLNKCEYLKKVYIALSAADESEYNQALKATSKIEIPCDVIWCNRPQVELILADLKKKGLDVTGLNGKGKDLWLTTGIASLELHAIAIHDADI